VSKSLLASSRNKWLLLVCWTVWTIVHFSTLYYWEMSWERALIDAIISNAFLAGACVLIINNLRFYRPKRNKYIYIIVLCITITGFWLMLVDYLLESIYSDNKSLIGFIEDSLPVRFNIGFLLTGCTAMISLLWYHSEDQQESRLLMSETQAIAKDAELYSLRQQLQPHFLFNSLNSISALVGNNPEQARNMINQLSAFLRGTMNKEDTKLVTLDEELNHLQLYLDIEKVRFGHRLRTVIHKPGKAFKLPPMILQPIVENAIKFGLYDTTGEVTIEISAEQSGNDLLITVKNPYDEQTAFPNKGTGFGLSSIKRRLFLLFTRTDLIFTSSDKQIFTTVVKIPQYD
jgi:sensor histidine kinase YesM